MDFYLPKIAPLHVGLFLDICQLVWLTKNTSYENVGGIFLRKNTIDS